MKAVPQQFDQHCLLRGGGNLFGDRLVRVASIADPSFLLGVGIVAGFGLAMLEPEAGMVTGLLACGAELLAVIFQHLPATCDHNGIDCCREL